MRIKEESREDSLRVKREIKREELDIGNHSTLDLTRIDSSQDEDSDAMPDCPVSDPRYLSWTRRQASKRSAVKSQIERLPQGFTTFQQRASKPHFEIKSEQQASCGPLVLGFADNGRPVEIPASINRFLRGYQRDGVKFFWTHYQNREGGLLGDDMGMHTLPSIASILSLNSSPIGLGKTIQVIAFFAAIMGRG